MKKYYYILGIALMTAFGSCGTSSSTQSGYNDEDGGITYQQFYDGLSPYGRWINDPGYGYVWAPDVDGFMPYGTNGDWVFTNYGWAWVSDYSWGWAPFHYGRWMSDPGYGWVWIPGYEWAPAWVAWRSGGGYYGWAPLGPGMTVNAGHRIPNKHWHFVAGRYINSPNISRYYVDNNTTVINNTTIINNNSINNRTVKYNTGPRLAEVEKETHSTIRPVRVVSRNKPGTTEKNNDELNLYRPQVRQTTAARPAKAAAPSPKENNRTATQREQSREPERQRPQRVMDQNRQNERSQEPRPQRMAPEENKTDTRPVENKSRPQSERPVGKTPSDSERNSNGNR